MSSRKSQALRPKLRFPEFRDSEGWEETTLRDVLFEHGLKSDGKSEVHSVSVHRGVINQKEHLGRSFAAADTSNYNLARPRDVIYTKSPTGDFPYGVIKHNHLNFNVIVSPLYGVFSPETPALGYIFDAYFESPIRTKNYLEPITQKGAKNTIQITNSTFLSNSICLPRNAEEQTRIADCLSSLDALIAAQTQKLDALRTHKQGLMQQLFPAEGERTPRLRFKEFEGAGEWEEKKLGEIAEFSSGGTPSKDVAEYWGGDIPWISASSMYEIRLNKSELNLTKLGVKNGSRIAKKGDILILVRGSMLYNRVPMGIADIDVAFNQDVKALRIAAGIEVNFLLYQLLSYESRIPILSTGIGAGKIETEGLKSFAIFVPTLPEQQRIANSLSSLDQLISAQSDKIAELKTFKRGLMQQLFPAPEQEGGG